MPDQLRSAAGQLPQDSTPVGGLNTELFEGLKRGLLIGVACAAVLLPAGGPAHSLLTKESPAAAAWPATSRHSPVQQVVADFGSEKPSVDARRIADWVIGSRDNGELSFIVIDKRDAKVFVFGSDGGLIAATPVLLGSAVGDDTAEGVGQKALQDVKLDERTTPAGRFIGQPGRNADGEDVFWVDYKAAVSMHRVRPLHASERRLERLASPTSADNRISYGCINMPVAFFEQVMVPRFGSHRGVVYVLPETRALEEVFPAILTAGLSLASRDGFLSAPSSH